MSGGSAAADSRIPFSLSAVLVNKTAFYLLRNNVFSLQLQGFSFFCKGICCMDFFSINMNGVKRFLTLLLVLSGALHVSAQKECRGYAVAFRVNEAVLDTAYLENREALGRLGRFVEVASKDSTLDILEVHLCGSASPEGSDQFNRHIARERLKCLEAYIRRHIDIPVSIIVYNDSYIPWDMLKMQVQDSDIDFKDEVLAIIGEEGEMVDYLYPGTRVDSRVMKLIELGDGKAWRQMNRLFFKYLRNASVLFVTGKEAGIVPPVMIPGEAYSLEEMMSAPVAPMSSAVQPLSPEWGPDLHVGINALGLGLGIANVSVEVDMARHWSFVLPAYYSAWNYFVQTVKFRTLAFQPELRFWFSKENRGWYLGGHFTYAQYNVAVGGDYRYQDHDRNTPALGGGIAVGYRLPVSSNGRWNLNFSVGCGVYPLHYDRFLNTDRTKDGLLVDDVKKTYWGVDQAAISVSYKFGLKKKKGGWR